MYSASSAGIASARRECASQIEGGSPAYSMVGKHTAEYRHLPKNSPLNRPNKPRLNQSACDLSWEEAQRLLDPFLPRKRAYQKKTPKMADFEC